MAVPGGHRQAVVRTAATLFRRQGYAATGTNQLVAESRAPKGSLYHYFPGGKEQIAEAAVTHSGSLVRMTLLDLLAVGPTPGEALRAYGELLVGWLERSDFRDGCPITTTLLELAPASEPVTAAGRAAFAGWVATLQQSLVATGAQPDRAARLAGLAVASLEGALVVARVQRDGRAVREAAEEVAALFDAATGQTS
jgi:TetR/AcrR family transcriptional repressor of lmrAB and yxaGH operons